MFDSKKTVVFITKDILYAADVEQDKNASPQSVKKYPWTQESLTQVLQQVINDFSSDFRLVVGEEFAYVTYLTVSDEHKDDREYIQEKAKEKIPERFDKTLWDFSVSKDDPNKIQIVALVSRFYKTYQSAKKQLSFKASVIEPMSVSLARFTASNDTLHITEYPYTSSDPKSLYVLSQSEFVFSTELVEGENPEKQRAALYKEAQKVLKNKTENKDAKNDQKKEQEDPRIDTVRAAQYDPMIGIALKKEVEGQDKEVLNIQDIASKNNTSKNITSWFKKKIVIAFIAILLLIGGGVLLYSSMQQEDLEGQSVQISPTSAVEEPSVTPEPTIQVAAEDYPLVILNGTGEPGDAGSLQDIMEEEGFVIQEVGNADSYTYDTTIIRYEESEVPEAFVNILDKALQDIYSDTAVEDVDSLDQNTNVIIITGSNKK